MHLNEPSKAQDSPTPDAATSQRSYASRWVTATNGVRSIWLSTTMPSEPSDYGPTLAVEELAANKILALFDRAEARDFLDLAELTHHFVLQSLLDLASQKDTGFDTAGFLEALSSFRRFTSADFGIDQAEYDQLRVTVANWRSDLARSQRREPPDRSQGLDR